MGILGAVIGDVIGSVYEFKPCINPDSCKLITSKSDFTDDTVMTFAVREAVLKGGTTKSFIQAYKDYGRRYPNRGYGSRFLQWLKLNSTSSEAYNSFGNGSAMRCSFIGQYDKFSSQEVRKYAKNSAIVTHNHPEGIKGAVFTADMTYHLRHGASKTRFSTKADITYPADRYPILTKWNETCQGSLPIAINCFLASNDFESCMRNVLRYPCDTDTIAAICGTWAEEYYQDTFSDFLEKFNIVFELSNMLPAEFVNALQKEYPRYFSK